MGFYVVTSHLFTLFGYFVINLVVFSRSRDMNGMSSPPSTLLLTMPYLEVAVDPLTESRVP